MEIALILVGLLVGLIVLSHFVLRRKRSKELKTDSHAITLEVPKSISPPKARSHIKAAFGSWKSLFQDKTKDRSRWEEALINSDLGPRLTSILLDKLEKSEKEAREFFRDELFQMIQGAEEHARSWEGPQPWVLYLVGVNGVGKTTTLVKLAHFFQCQGKKVGVVAADTFRKAAVEQLQRGVSSVGADFFSIQGSEEQVEGADPSAVIFDGLQKFKSSQDVILVDTSGRLHTKKNLMEELKKMKKVADRVVPGAPHDVWLIIDATLGQNAAFQAKSFQESLGLSGLILTKLDGLSRGGSVFQLVQELNLPIRFLGTGEAKEDLEVFKAESFVDSLFQTQSPENT